MSMNSFFSSLRLPFTVVCQSLYYNSLNVVINLYKCGGYRSRTDDPLRARQVL